MSERFNYGGGRQTVAMCILIAKGVLPRPDITVIADTSRENPSTWEYMRQYTQPLMQSIGLDIEVASHDLATVDTHSHKGDLLLPVWTHEGGKLSAYCSGEWKRDVCERYARKRGYKRGTSWLGFAFDERKRWKRSINGERHNWKVRCPLVELCITTHDCLQLIKDHGWPEPRVSSCWMCPNKANAEWRQIRDEQPELFAQACEMDEEERAADERGGVYFHHSRVPLREADLGAEDRKTAGERQCTLGMCFI